MAAKSKTRYAVLGMLSFQPMSGYDIKKEIEEGFSTFWSESFGQIYKVLKQLVEEKLVVKEHIRQKGRPSKDLYSITDRGKEQLQKYLSTPPDKLIVRDEMLLKLIFGFNVPRENSIALLEHELKRLNTKLEDIEQNSCRKLEKTRMEDHAKVHISLIIKLGRELLKTKARWCKEAIKLFKETDEHKKDDRKVKEMI